MIYRPKVQVSPNEKTDSLEECLRQIQRIEFRLVEIELKGKKVESRVRRTSSQRNMPFAWATFTANNSLCSLADFEWKKNKDLGVFADAIVARCEALRKQSIAVHK